MVVRACRLLPTGDRPALSLYFTLVAPACQCCNASRKINKHDPIGESPSCLILAMEATANLSNKDFDEFREKSQSDALFVHSQIETLLTNQRAARFYSVFGPLLQNLVKIFIDTYRRLFRLALANSLECGSKPHDWACNQLQGGIAPVAEWILDWYALACDGENRSVQRAATIPFVPNETVSASISTSSSPLFDAKSWLAPAWLFAVSPLMGFGPLKSKNVPDMDSDQRLSRAQTRLLLKGMRRVFLWKLRGEIETARNEETAAAGAIVITSPAAGTKLNDEVSAKRQPKGFEGLGPKEADLSQYMDGLTEKQQMAFSLKYEYRCGLAEIASRMGIDRKTAYEHIDLANKKVREHDANQKRKAHSSQHPSE
jgi:hypothetical protein